MSNDTLYSFIIPVYRAEKYIQECIDSLRSQTYENVEIILVDDGSPDGSPMICDKNAAEDERVRVIHKENGGAADARLAGVEAAKGEYVICVDSDDWLDLDCVEKVNTAVETNGHPDIITYGHYRMSKTGSIQIKPNMIPGFYSKERILKDIFPMLIQNNRAQYYPPGLCGEVIRRDLLHGNMITTREAVIGEDMACTIPCIYHANTLYILDECLYYYRYNEASVTKDRKPFPWGCAKAIARHLEEKIDLTDADLQMQVARYVVHMLFITAVSQYHQDTSTAVIKKTIRSNFEDNFYREMIKKCRFRYGTKGWFAQIAVKYRLYSLMRLYSKVR